MRGRCWVVCLNDHPMAVCDGSGKQARHLMRRLIEQYYDDYHFAFESHQAYLLQSHWELRQVSLWRKS